jgi:hypothetical protein
MLTRATSRFLAAVGAAALLASAIGTASARNISTIEQNIRATWSSFEFNASEAAVVRCPLTLEGSFHTRTIAKVAEELIGAVTKSFFGFAACTGGTLSAFNGVERYNGTTTPNALRWHETYKGFSGVLPIVTVWRWQLRRFRFGFRDAAGFCTGQLGSETDGISFGLNRERSGAITSLESIAGENTATFIRRDGGMFCPASATATGRAGYTRLGTTAPMFIELI